jgi:CelD/BcsL family acetyltransferase involved in cellulose biosynthesis
MTMKLQWYSDVAGFDALRSDWNRLLQSSATDTLFLTWEWQRAWWDTLGAAKDLWLAAGRDEGGQICAIIPLFSQATWLDTDSPMPSINIENPTAVGNGSWQRTVHLVGGSEVSDYLDIIAPPTFNHQAWDALFESMAQQEAWNCLDLRNIPAASPSLEAVTELARSRGWSVQTAKEDVCPVLQLPSTWDEYLATRLDKKQRHELRRKVRRAEQETTADWYWAGKENLNEALDVFVSLHKASASAKEAFMDQRMEGFFRAAARATADQGWLRLSVLRFDGRPVASYLCFDYQGDRLVYNSGFDLSAYRELSPGIVLVAYMIEDAISQGCRRFDFLQGNERYKYEFGAVDTEVMRLFVRR